MTLIWNDEYPRQRRTGSKERQWWRKQSGHLRPHTELNMTRDEVLGGQYLKAVDILGKKIPVTVESVELIQTGREGEPKKNKLILSFVGKDKRLILNVSNTELLFEILDEDTDNWPGKKFLLTTHMVKFAGNSVPGFLVQKLNGVKKKAPVVVVQDEDEETGDSTDDDNNRVPF